MKNGFSLMLLGAGMGCGIALLLAREPGRRLRARMRQQAMKGTACLQQSATEMEDMAVDLARRASEAIETQRSGLRAAWNAGIRAYNKTVRA